MIIIKVFSDFCDTNCWKHFVSINDLENDCNYNEKYKFTEGDDYTHVIILNTATPILKKIPKENVIGLAFEPTPFLNLNIHFINYAKKNIGKYFIGDKKNLGEPFIERHGYLWHKRINSFEQNKIENKREKKMSIIMSHKLISEQHKYRHLLALCILRTDLPIDIYGTGCKFYNIKDDRIKGPFEDKEPYINYKYHITVENFSLPHYFSEKIVNPLLYNCVPIYLGCKHDYFPNMTIRLSGDLNKDMELITNICNSDDKNIPNIDIDKIDKVTNIKYLIEELFLQ